MSLTQVFLTFRENLLEPQTTSMYGIVPSCGEPIPYRKSDLLSFKTDKPFYIADSFATPSNEEEDDITEYYAVLGTPSDFDCIFLLLDLTNGVVEGYDRMADKYVYHKVRPKNEQKLKTSKIEN